MAQERNGGTTECASGWSVEDDFSGDAVVREFDETEPPSVALITAVSECKGIEPTDLSPPLHDVVDPDALDNLFDRPRGSLTRGGVLEISEYDCHIQVYADGRIEVRSDAHVQ